MTRIAPLVSEDDTPEGMVHVGWRCTSPDHECLMPLSRVEHVDAEDPELVWLRDANHHANWTPVFARADELPKSAPKPERAPAALERWSLGAPPGDYTLLIEANCRRVHGRARVLANGTIEVTDVHQPDWGCCAESPGNPGARSLVTGQRPGEAFPGARHGGPEVVRNR